MLKLLAVARADGWAFVERDHEVLLVRPPYRQANLAEASMASVEEAVTHHGFAWAEEQFGSWDALVGHLREQIAAAHEERGLSIPEPGVGAEVIQHLPGDVLGRYLDRIEQELLPNGEYDAALDVLSAVSNTQTAKADPALMDRAVGLIGASVALRKRHERGRRELSQQVQVEGLAQAFPLAAERHGTEALALLAESVIDRRQVFPTAA